MNLKKKIVIGTATLLMSITSVFNASAITTELHTAVKVGDIEKVKTLCQEHPEWINEYDDSNFLPLAYAHNGEIVRCLVGHGADATFAICGLSKNGLDLSSDSIRYLEEHGANVNMCLIDAVHVNDLDLVKHLLERGADANHGLTTAFYNNNLELFKYFVEHGASKGLALDQAIRSNNIDLARYLVEECGANATEGMFRAVGANCSGINNTDLIEYLVEHGADVNEGFNYALMDLMDLNFNLAKWFLDHGADINIKDSDGCSMLRASLDYLSDMEHGTEKYPFLSAEYINEECERVRTLIDFLRSNGAKE